jgi:hypothetical protein
MLSVPNRPATRSLARLPNQVLFRIELTWNNVSQLYNVVNKYATLTVPS